MKRLTLRQLRIFEAVARTRSFTRASAELHLTQPAVSMQIKLLEEATGTVLLERVKKQLFLTEAGRLLQRHAGEFRRQFEALESDLASLKGAEAGTLHLTVPGTANAFTTRYIAEFRRRHPAIRFQLSIANRAGLLKAIEENSTDLAIMGLPPAHAGLVSERFMNNPLVVIAAPDHPLASRTRRVALKTLMEHEFVVRETGSGTRNAVERFCGEHDIELQSIMEVSSNDSIKQTVAAGLGLGIVSLHTLEAELALGTLAVIRVQHFPIMRHWYLVHREDKQLSPVSEAFHRFVREEGEALWPLAAQA